MSNIGPSSDPDLGRLLGLIRRWWWLLVAAAVVGGWIAYGIGTRTAIVYEAKATVLVGPLQGESNTLRAAGQEAATLASVAVSRSVLVAAQHRAGAAAEGEITTGRVGATADETTRLLTVVARAGNPRHAAVIANAIASELPDAGGRVAGSITVVDPAQPPLAAVGSGAKALAAIGGLALVLLVLMVLLVHDYFRGRVAREADLTEATGVAHLATLRRSSRNASPLAVNARTTSAGQFRLLAGRIALAGPHGSSSVVVTGADAGETSADVAGNLATALAADGRRVVLVDADAEAGEVTRLLGLESRIGLGDLLKSTGKKLRVSDLAIEQGSHLRVLPVGDRDGHRAVDARVAEQLLKLILEDADAVVVSTSPAATSAATLAWVRGADGTVLLARRAGTRRDAVIRTKAAISDVGGRLLGTVLAERPRARLDLPGTIARLRRPLRGLPIARRENAGEAAS
jgi:tyrosine-protein kinase